MKKEVVRKILEGNFTGAYTIEKDQGELEDVETLPGGIYKLTDVGGMFRIKLVYSPIKSTDTYVDVVGGTVEKVIFKISRFFAKEVKEKYEELGIGHKSGLVLYGKPGTGKTATSYIIMQNLVKLYGAVCITIEANTHPGNWQKALGELAKFERPIIIFCDECESNLNNYESTWLTFLDGYESISNFMFIGCTNYINKIPARLKRPSRIEHLVEVESIEESFARAYVDTKLKKVDKKVKDGVVHFAIENKATIDEYKNAIKEFYIHTNANDPLEFEEILKGYLRSEPVTTEDLEAEQD